MKSSYSNRDLIEKLQSGEEGAFVYLVHTYQRPLLAFILSLNSPDVKAEDVVQNVFIRTWEFRKKLDPQFSIKSFLFRTARNEFINEYRKHKAITKLELAYMEELEISIDNSDIDPLDKKATILNKEIEKLPEKCKQIFLLSKKEGLTNNEIAEYLNISVKTVEGHLTKAFTILRNRIPNNMKNILFLLFTPKKKIWSHIAKLSNTQLY